jgi:hypothetical protein
MDSPVDPIVSLVVRPFAGRDELQTAAAAELRDRLAGAAAATPEAVAEVTAAFEQADARPWRGRWRVVLGLVTGVVSLPLLVSLAVHYLGGLAVIRTVTSQDAGRGKLNLPVGKDLSPAERLLLAGAPDTRKDDERWRPLWESAPDKPAYLAEYALAFLRTRHELSPEIQEAAARIDPDNGWFPALAAAGLAEGVVKKGTRSSKEKREGKAIAWEVLNEPRLREALLQLHRAATKPRFTGYRAELHRERAPLLPPRDDFMSQWVWLAYSASAENSVIPFRHLGEAIAAGAGLCAARQDVEGFQQILADWRWLTHAVIHDGETLIDQLVARVLVTTPLANFRDAARTLGLEAEAAKFAALEEQERTTREARDRSPQALHSVPTERGSMLARLSLVTPSVIQSPPAVTEQDLRPGRLADHAVFDQAAAVVTWGVLGLGVAGAGLLFRGRAVIRAVALRMLDLVRPSDWAWILLGGVVVPVLWYLAVTRLTPLSAREWSLWASGFLLPASQTGALILLLAVCPLVLAGWRLGKRGAVFGMTGKWPKLGWLAVAAAALAVPVAGGIGLGPAASPLSLALVLLGMAACWLFAAACQYTAGAKSQDLRRATVVRMAVPAWLCGMLGCVLALPLHQLEERHWLRQDRLLATPAERPGIASYEARLVDALRAETLKLAADL